MSGSRSRIASIVTASAAREALHHVQQWLVRHACSPFSAQPVSAAMAGRRDSAWWRRPRLRHHLVGLDCMHALRSWPECHTSIHANHTLSLAACCPLDVRVQGSEYAELSPAAGTTHLQTPFACFDTFWNGNLVKSPAVAAQTGPSDARALHTPLQLCGFTLSEPKKAQTLGDITSINLGELRARPQQVDIRAAPLPHCHAHGHGRSAALATMTGDANA